MELSRHTMQRGYRYRKAMMEKIKDTFGLNPDSIRIRDRLSPGPDLVLDKEASDIVRLSLLVRNLKNFSIKTAVSQAKRVRVRGTLPAVIFRISKQGIADNWIAVPIDHYLSLRSADGKTAKK